MIAVVQSSAAACDRFTEVATYFGTETPNPQHFFGIIATYKRDLHRAHEENMAQIVAANKQALKKEKEMGK